MEANILIKLPQRIKFQFVIFSALWMLGAVVYAMHGDGKSHLWWAFDKLNDRLFEACLIYLFASIFSNYGKIQLYAYATIFYVFLRAAFEVIYIYYDNKGFNLCGFPNVLLVANGIWVGIMLFITAINGKSIFK